MLSVDFFLFMAVLEKKHLRKEYIANHLRAYMNTVFIILCTGYFYFVTYHIRAIKGKYSKRRII